MINEERTLILKMLEEGKITLEEADTLLDALDILPAGEAVSSGESVGSGKNKSSSKGSVDFESFKEQLRGIKDSLNDGISAAKKDLQRAKKDLDESNIGGEVSGFLNSIVDSFRGSFGPSYQFEDNLQGSFALKESENAEVKIDIRNGGIVIESIEGNDYTIRLRSSVKAENESKAKLYKEEELQVIQENNRLEISVKGRKISTSVRLGLPQDLFYQLKLDSSNGRIAVSDLQTVELEADTSNGSILFKNLAGKILSADTSNGRIEMHNVQADTLKADTSNGSIYIDGKGSVFKGDTSNGSITIKPLFVGDGEVVADTSNGRIRIGLPDDDSVGYNIKARTTWGSLTLNLEDLDYKERTDSYKLRNIMASTKDWQSKAVKAQVVADTSTGSIYIGRISKGG